MVFFICNHCGESVKKMAVEKHYLWKCRNKLKNVSCMDCMKDFFGEDYNAHTSCISEAKKYSGKDFVAKEPKIKNKLQNTWLDIINRILTTEANLPANVKTSLKRLRGYNNIPQKKEKFRNFVSNCLKLSTGDADAVWTVLEAELLNVKKEFQEEKKLQMQKMENAKRKACSENGDLNGLETDGNQENAKSELENEKIAKKNKKNKKQKLENGHEDSVNTNDEATTAPVGDFQWSEVAEKVLSAYEDGMKLTKFKRKIRKHYLNHYSLKGLNDAGYKEFEKGLQNTLENTKGLKVKDFAFVVFKKE